MFVFLTFLLHPHAHTKCTTLIWRLGVAKMLKTTIHLVLRKCWHCIFLFFLSVLICLFILLFICILCFLRVCIASPPPPHAIIWSLPNQSLALGRGWLTIFFWPKPLPPGGSPKKTPKWTRVEEAGKYLIHFLYISGQYPWILEWRPPPPSGGV